MASAFNLAGQTPACDTIIVLCGVQSGLGPGALGPGTLDAIQDSVSLRILSVVQGLSVSILNIGVGVLIPMVTDFERNLTATSAMLSLVIKLSVFYILNSFVVPIAVVTALPGSDGLWCASYRRLFLGIMHMPVVSSMRCNCHMMLHVGTPEAASWRLRSTSRQLMQCCQTW